MASTREKEGERQMKSRADEKLLINSINVNFDDSIVVVAKCKDSPREIATNLPLGVM